MEDDNRPSKTEAVQSKARENIKALTAISEDLPSLLQSAGSALALLSTNQTIPQDTTLEQRQAAFTTNVKEYYTNLNAIQNALLKQVDVLEEASILPREQDRSDSGSSASAPNAVRGGGSAGTSVAQGGGMGNFDVAWLNARSRDVGRAKERELVAEAKAWLAQLDQKHKKALDQDVMEE